MTASTPLSRWRARRNFRDEVMVLGLLECGYEGVTEMWRAVGGNVSNIYAALARLEAKLLVNGWWEMDPGDRPARRFYYRTATEMHQ